MGISIHNNFESVRLTNDISQRAGKLSLLLRRLSKSTRITRAADDAAGLAISERLNAELRQAQGESRDALTQTSLLQTADAALAEMQERVQKMRELAVQAGNEALSFTDKKAIEEQFNALMGELDEISAQTTFNGRKLLDGSAPSLALSLTSDSSDTLHLKSYTPEALGRQSRNMSARRGVFLSPLSTGDLTINDVAIRATTKYDDQLSYSYSSGSAIAKAKAINAASSFTGVRAIASENLIRGHEPLQALVFAQTHWLALNGVQLSAFTLEAKDATGALRRAVNRELSSTGVRAEVDSSGALVLIAEDGRNITLEYSDASVRDALRVVDSYGDPNNLSDTVDPAVLTLDGDVTSVDFVMNGGGAYNGAFTVVGDKIINNILVADASGGYSRPRDNVDYVLEVVNPGALGVATFRYKEEAVSDYAVDSPAESYLFNSKGVVTPATGHTAVQSASYYNEASRREYRLHVTRGGLPSAPSDADLPQYYYEVFNLDTNTLEYTSPTITADQGSPETLLHNVIIDYPTTSYAYNNFSNTTLLNSNNMSSYNAAGDQYGGQPRFVSWSGVHSTNFTFEVVGAGHASLTPIAGSNTPYAQVRVIAEKTAIGVTTSQTFTVSPNTDVTFEGLTFNFTPQSGGVSNVSLSGAYNGSQSASSSVFVGTQNYKYVVKALSDGKISSSSTVQGQVFIYDASNNLISDSQTVTLRSGANIELGAGASFEGVRLTLGASTASLSGLRSNGNYTNFSLSGPYTGAADQVGVFRITQAGRPGQSARFEYYYQSDPSNKLTGAVQSSTTLLEGVKIGFSQPTALMSALSHTINQNATPVSTSFSSSGYTAEQGATSVVMDVVDDGVGGQDLVTSWTFADGSTDTVTSELNIGANTSVGYGVTVKINDPVSTGDRFTSDISLNPLEVGDEWTLTLDSGAVKAGDTFTINTSAADLAVGSKWYARGEVSEWVLGETYTLTANHNFSATPQTLTSTINLPGVGTVNLTGAGSFNTGDEIRIHTRGYVGSVESSGYYTNNLYPTEYRMSVTQAGPLGAAALKWWRADGRTDTENGGSGVINPGDIASGQPVYLEEGVYVTFNDPASGPARLSEGDYIRIPAGQRLNYTFGGQLTLQSEDNIELSYADNTQDNLLGRLMFMGDAAVADEQGGDELSLQRGVLGSSTTRSLSSVGVLSKAEVDEALSTLDLALKQLGEGREALGGALSGLERRMAQLSQKAISLAGARLRIEGADYAQEVVSLAAEQIKMMSAPRLAEFARAESLVALNLVQQNDR